MCRSTFSFAASGTTRGCSRLRRKARMTTTQTTTIGGPYEWAAYRGNADAYTEAARVVLSAAMEEGMRRRLARPCFFLQRHALELYVKAFRSCADDILSRSGLPQHRPLARKDMHHELSDLVAHTTTLLQQPAIASHGWQLPDEIIKLVPEIEAAEPAGAGSARYETARDGRPTYPDEVGLSFESWQSRLEEIRDIVSIDNKVGVYTSMLFEQHRLIAPR